MDITDGKFLTALLDVFRTQSEVGAANIYNEVLYVIFSLSVIELALSFLLNLDQDHFKMLIGKILRIGFFVWLAHNWNSGLKLCRMVFESFQKLGVKAAGVSVGETDPSAIGEAGLTLIKQVLISITGMSGAATVMGSLGTIVFKSVLVITIVFCVFYMAIELFLTTLEFYILSTVTVILLPFGITRYLSFLSEKAIGAIFSISIKMMVLQFILCIAVPIMEKWTQINADGNIASLFHAVLGCGALALATWKGPEIAMGLLSGSPSLNGGSAIGQAQSMASTVKNYATGGMRNAGAIYQATRVTNGQRSMAQFAQNLRSAAVQQTSFGQGRQLMRHHIQAHSQMDNNDQKGR